MRKIVVASDSFKGSVSSIEVAECAELAIHKVFPDCEVVKIPVGDGGEGTVETLITAMGGEVVSCVVHDPLMRPVEATYGILGDNRTAVIEMATASGLTLVLENNDIWNRRVDKRRYGAWLPEFLNRNRGKRDK